MDFTEQEEEVLWVWGWGGMGQTAVGVQGRARIPPNGKKYPAQLHCNKASIQFSKDSLGKHRVGLCPIGQILWIQVLVHT